MAYDSKKFKDGFLCPASEHRWFSILHNVVNLYRKDKDNFAQILQSIKDEGQGGLVTNIPMSKEYLDDPDAFSDLNEAVKMMLDAGLKFWIYDELGYPSCAAGGRTTLNHPEYIAKGIVYTKTEGQGYTKTEMLKEDDVLKLFCAYAVNEKGEIFDAEVSENKVVFDGTDGKWTLYVFSVKNFYEGTHAETNGFGGTNWINRQYPDIMNKDAVGEFVNNTYKAYADNFKYFSESGAVFTDEPSLMEIYQHTGEKVFKYAQLAWTEEFCDKFEQMHGYRFEKKLHLIFEGDTDEAKIVRINYRQTVAELVAMNYFRQLSDFCEAHGTRSSGHMLLEEALSFHAFYYGDLMRCQREMTSPGVDSLNGVCHSFMYPGWSTHTAVKVVTSVATITDKDRLSMVEFCAVDLPEFNDSSADEIWKTASVMYFSGLTQLNGYFPFDLERRHRPNFGDYIGRIAYISKNSVWNGEVGLYYPINSHQAYTKPSFSAKRTAPEGASRIDFVSIELYKNRMDYTIVDNIFINEAKIENGTLTNGHASFKAICVPNAEAMPLSVLKKLIDFEKNGGKVVWIDRVPHLSDKLSELNELRSLTSALKVSTLEDAMKAVKAACSYPNDIESDASDLLVGKYTLDGAEMYWLFNKGNEDITVKINDGAHTYDVYDPFTGEIASVNAESDVQISKFNTKFVVVKN